MYNAKNDEISSTMQHDVNEIATVVNNVFVTTESDSVLLGSLTSISGATTFNVPDTYQYTYAYNDIDSAANNSFYSSVELFIEKSEEVYISNFGIYTYNQYLNQEVVNTVNNGSYYQYFITNNYIDSAYADADSTDVITYLRRLPLSSSYSTGYLAINISLNSLQELIKTTANSSYDTVVVFFRDQLIYSSSSAFVFNEDINTSIMDYYNTTSMTYSVSNNFDDVTCIYFTDNSLISAQMILILKICLILSLFLLSLTFVLSYLYSYYMLQPIESFIKKIGLSDNFSQGISVSDEVYDKISDEFDLLKNYNKKFDPLDRERQILELITSYNEITSEKIADCKGKNIILNKDSYAVIMISVKNDFETMESSDFETIKMISRKNAENRFSKLGNVYGCYNESNVILFLLNYDYTPNSEDKLSQMCQNTKDYFFKNFNTKTLFTYGFCKGGINIPYQAYLQARKNMFATMEGLTALDINGSTYEYIPAADKKSAYNIAQSIINQDVQELNAHFKMLINRSVFSNSAIGDARKVANTSICRVYTRLIETGFDPDEGDLISALSKLKDATSVNRCTTIAINYFSDMIGSETKVSDNSYTYIRSAIEYIEANYQKPLSIPEIADSVSINSVYLSRIFKNSTGKTMNEYLNQYRITQAKKALKETNLSIHEISVNIGYADVRSFIRFFKKYTNLTPLEFRKSDNQ